MVTVETPAPVLMWKANGELPPQFLEQIAEKSSELADVEARIAEVTECVSDVPGRGDGSGETELVFEREVFQYPSFTRRNPFRALGIDDGGGPRYEQLSLIGIMYSDDPSASVAVVSTGGVAVLDDVTTSPIAGEAYYLKVGEQLGNLTVTAIHRDRVEVVVSEFDDRIPRTMSIESRRPGGSP